MITISNICHADRNAWQGLFAAYAAFYEMSVTEEVIETVWNWIVDDTTPFYCLVAKTSDGTIIGFAHYKAIPSPLRGKSVGFLDDLFVDSAYRGEGAVDALFGALKKEAESRGWPFIRWITKDNNYRARAVYDKYAIRTDWLTYQLNVQ